jgi:hypothetical protein
MIARTERTQLALQLRRLASGRISNDDFEDGTPRHSPDAAVQELFLFGWSLYHDYSTYRLRGRQAPSREVLDIVARCVLFLDSDLEYEWPEHPPRRALGWIVALLTLGWVDIRRLGAWQQWRRTGDFEVWPFFRRTDCELARANPRFFTGRGAAAA